MMEPLLLIFGINIQLDQYILIQKVLPKVNPLLKTVQKFIDNKIKQFGLGTIIILMFNTILGFSMRCMEVPHEIGVFISIAVAGMTFYGFYAYMSKLPTKSFFQILAKAGVILYTIYNLFDFIFYLLSGNFYSDEWLPDIPEVV